MIALPIRTHGHTQKSSVLLQKTEKRNDCVCLRFSQLSDSYQFPQGYSWSLFCVLLWFQLKNYACERLRRFLYLLPERVGKCDCLRLWSKKKRKREEERNIYNNVVAVSKKTLTSAHLATSGLPQTLSPRHPVNRILKVMGFCRDVVRITCLPQFYCISIWDALFRKLLTPMLYTI